MRRARTAGFTIVEMLMVIGILAVLMGIVTTAASAAIRQARERRTEASKQIIQSGIASYLAQKNHWPPKGGQLQDWADNGLGSGKRVDFLSADQYDKMMYELAKVSVGSRQASPVMDFNGVVVATRTAASKAGGRGQNFSEAIKKNKKHGSTIKLGDMVFGYQERYAEYRYKPSMITGKLRSTDPHSLDVWHLAQEFAQAPTLSKAFIVFGFFPIN